MLKYPSLMLRCGERVFVKSPDLTMTLSPLEVDVQQQTASLMVWRSADGAPDLTRERITVGVDPTWLVDGELAVMLKDRERSTENIAYLRFAASPEYRIGRETAKTRPTE